MTSPTYLFVVEKLSDEEKLQLFRLIIDRYTGIIDEKESKSISEIRQRVSPYVPFVEKLKDSLLSELQPYEYKANFFSAVQKAIEHLKGIRVFKLPFTFWLSFEEIDELKSSSELDKAVLFAALLRAFGSEDVVVTVTKSQKPFVRFSWKEESYLYSPETDSLISGDYLSSVFEKDAPLYNFSDLKYESFEE